MEDSSRFDAENAHRAEAAERHAREAAEAKATRARRVAFIAGIVGVLALVALAVTTIVTIDMSRQIANTRLEMDRFNTLEAGDVFVPLLTQTPDLFIPTLTQIAVLNAHDPSQAEYRMTDEFGVEMVFVPAGCFFMGSDRGNIINERPSHQVCLEAFWIDRFEVTNAQFGALGGEAEPARSWTRPNQPRTAVTWDEARAFCEEKRQARLPTEAEWEYAARGPNSLVFPWGNTFPTESDQYVVFARDSPEPADVGEEHRAQGQSWVGAYDMSGNVWEWVSTAYDNLDERGEFPYPYDPNDGREDLNRRDVSRVVRGGSFAYLEIQLRATIRFWVSPGIGGDNFGIRCARSG